jgi:putative peptide zinc metalloprotease protein
MQANIFSENWFRVSNLKVSLLDSVKIYPQVFKNETWYLLEDIHNNKHYRIQENSYKFIKSLDHNKTIEDNWNEYIDKYPKIAPNQEEVIYILIQLHDNNVLYYKNRGDSQYIYNKSKAKKRKELQQKIQSFLFLKVPIFNPNKMLDSFKPISNIIFSMPSFIIWLIFIIFALNLVIVNHNEIFSQTEGILAPSNLFLLYGSIFILKLFHELAHGIATKKYGGDIYTFGMMFIIFTPLPYVDASNSWSFKDKWQRIIVSAAGMYIELFLAAISAIIWANTGDGVIHSIAFNMMIAGSVSSILFNANPLLKFDSYFILSDYLEIPNLYQRSHAYILSLMKSIFFGIKESGEYIANQKEAKELFVYGVLSYIYKLVLTIGIIIFVADRWFILGAIIFITSFYLMILKPIYNFIIFILYSHKLYKNRNRAKVVTAILATIFIYIFFIHKSDDYVKANGIVNLKTQEQVFIKTEGILEQIYINSSEQVNRGDKLFKLTNKELDFNIEYTNYQLQENIQKRLKALNEYVAHIEPINEKIDFLTQKLKHLKDKRDELIIKSNTDGVMVLQPQIKEYINNHLKINIKVAEILNHDNYEFIAIISQEDAIRLFEQYLGNSQLKLDGDIPNTLNLSNVVIIPHEKDVLPSQALSWSGGGDIETVETRDNTIKTAESFFELRADIEPHKNRDFYQNQYGTIKIVLDEITLYQRCIRFVSQLMQKRYRL